MASCVDNMKWLYHVSQCEEHLMGSGSLPIQFDFSYL